MKRIATTAFAFMLLGAPAWAAIPLVNATCPGDIEVHTDEGGPIYINGTEAKLQVFNENYYEAKHNHTTISLTINPDGTPDVSYTGQHGANGVCQIADDYAPPADGECPVDVSEADRAKYPACK